MRSSKSRSRSKSNRSRSVGNIVNRVFDSSGPEGKVRGTPQQIIDKYTQLARDATLGNDRVAAENFQQHAEHYARMLGEAQREQEARREQQDQQNRERQRERHEAQQTRTQQEPQAEGMQAVDPGSADQPDVIEDSIQSAPQPDIAATPEDTSSNVDGNGGSGLVETPESAPKPARRPRTRKPKPKAEAPAEAPAESEAPGKPDAPEAAE